MVNVCSEIFLLGFAATALPFSLPVSFYLCFQHVDNLGAYSIPSGDRPSHPIWFRQLSNVGAN
jgi:hypothetical protein